MDPVYSFGHPKPNNHLDMRDRSQNVEHVRNKTLRGVLLEENNRQHEGVLKQDYY